MNKYKEIPAEHELHDFIEFTDLLYNCMVQRVSLGHVSLIRTVSNYVEKDYDKYILVNNVNRARLFSKNFMNAYAIVIEIIDKDCYDEDDYAKVETVIINYIKDEVNYKSDDVYICNVDFIHDLRYIE